MAPPVSPHFREDATMYVLLEAWNASPRAPQPWKLLQLERAVCVLVARSGRPVGDCMMGVIAAGPHMTERTCAAFHAAVLANAEGLPHLHELCGLRRFLGVQLEATSVGELELALEGLRSDMNARLGRVEATVSGLQASVSGLQASVSMLIERFNELLDRQPAAVAGASNVRMS